MKILFATLLLGASLPLAAQDNTAWLAQAQQQLVQREYFVSPIDAGLQAPNRAQGFRTFFETDGIRLVTRDVRAAPLAGLAIAGIGRGDASQSLTGGSEFVTENNHVTQRWPGMDVHYRNSAEGLAQEIVLTQAALGAGQIVLRMDIDGATAQLQAEGAMLRSDDATLHLSAPTVHDADGRVLPVSTTVVGQQLQLTIDDQAARYPIAIKSIVSGTADGFIERNQEFAALGSSVAGAGDVNGDGFADVIVGAFAFDSGQIDEGAAFVYFGGSAAFDTNPDAQLQSDQAGANFGFSVAGAGDVNGDGFADVIVGAIRFDSGQNDEGAAFIYFGGNGAFNTSADARLESNQAGDLIDPGPTFGVSVAGAGDVNGDGFADVVVGAPRFNTGVTRGAAFVYLGSAGAFDPNADAQLNSTSASFGLGSSVAAAGDVNGDGFADVIVGGSGAALVYFGGVVFNATVDALLQSNQADAQFGMSVAGAGDVNGDGFADVLVGADRYDSGQSDEGAAFLYFGSSDAFNITADALLQSNQTNAWFGASVAGAGDVNGDGFADVIVGAYLYDSGQSDEGAAFIYFGAKGTFDATADARLEANQSDALFGISVAGGGDVNGDGFADVLVGASAFDNGQTNEGAAFLFTGGAGAFSATADAQLQSNQVNSNLGFSVAGAGDVNGDGFGDVVVGALVFDNGQADEGAAFVYFGSADSLDLFADAVLESNQANAFMGRSVAAAGDVNGDGYGDVIVGASGFDNGHADEGVAFIYFGGPGAFNAVADALLEPNQAFAAFGTSVANAGDVNGDGFGDVIVGAIGYDNGEANEGAAFVYFGSAGAFNLSADSQLESNQNSAQFGYSVAGAGDVNGDGFADVVVGANLHDNGENNEGAAFVYFGGVAFNSMADAFLESNQVDAQFGFSVAGAGDVNGDGASDLLVGAPLFDTSFVDAGQASLFLGGSGAFNTDSDQDIRANQAGARMGHSAAGVGDVNADGFADVVISAPRFDNGQADEGVAVVLLGRATAVLVQAAGLESNQAGAQFGFSAAGAGDVNGDGFADVIIGAPFFDDGQNDEGAAFVYFGAARGQIVQSTQARRGGAPIAAWGASQQADGFVVAINATSPRGRERARLQVEACPNGAAFGSPLCDTRTASSWTETIADDHGPLLMVLPLTGLTTQRLYHWRARAQYAPLTAITPPVNPAVGPWRRLQANADVADIRTRVTDLIFANGFQ